MSWGLLGGIGRGLQQGGAMMWEQAKQDELNRIRVDEKATDVLDKEGNIIAQRGADNTYNPISNPEEGNRRRVYDNAVDTIQDAFSRYDSVETMPESIRARVESSMAIAQDYESQFLPEGFGDAAAGPGGMSDENLAAAIRAEAEANAAKKSGAEPAPKAPSPAEGLASGLNAGRVDPPGEKPDWRGLLGNINAGGKAAAAAGSIREKLRLGAPILPHQLEALAAIPEEELMRLGLPESVLAAVRKLR